MGEYLNFFYPIPNELPSEWLAARLLISEEL